MSEIVGGIDAFVRDNVDTITVGGSLLVVGQSVVAGMRDRAIYLTDGLNDMDEKKLLSIVGMAQPLTFGIVEYDDGKSGYVIPKAAARRQPDDKLMESLASRLSLAPTKVIDTLVRDFGLDRPVFLAMGEFVTSVVGRINSCLIERGKKSLDTIMIAPKIGELVPFAAPGILEVSSIENAAEKWPTTFASLMEVIENFAVTKKCIVAGQKLVELPDEMPPYPVLSHDIIKSISEEVAIVNSTREYVAAIILRENKLVPHLVAIEEYNVRLAQAIQKYTAAILSFF